MSGRLERTFAMQTRQIDEEKRTAELSFSSEEPYNRWWGTEILDHSEGCVDLVRLQEIGCMLFNHNRDKVIGKVLTCSIEGNRGVATVQFDEDAESDTSTGVSKFCGFRYVVGGRCVGAKPGSVQPANPMSSSATIEATYVLVEIDGEKVVEIDKLNNICKIDGTDLLEEVRRLC